VAVVDLWPPDRRGAGLIRPGPLRRHLDLPGPEGLTDEQVLYLADILPTGYGVGVLPGQVQPGDTVAIVGAGPVGLAAILGARLYSPTAIVTIDPTPARRDWAEQFGANVVTTPGGARGEIDQLTDGLGADVAVEAVGIPETFEQCTERIRPDGQRRGARQAGDAAP
jgi:alcohol dehydrogenase